MSDRVLDRLEAMVDKQDTRIDKISDTLSEINVILAKNTESLEYHIKRTNLLEKKFESLPNKVLTIITLLSAAITLLAKFR